MWLGVCTINSYDDNRQKLSVQSAEDRNHKYRMELRQLVIMSVAVFIEDIFNDVD